MGRLPRSAPLPSAKRNETIKVAIGTQPIVGSARSPRPVMTRGRLGYRVSVVPGPLEISARLGTPEEIRGLAKVLKAGRIH